MDTFSILLGSRVISLRAHHVLLMGLVLGVMKPMIVCARDLETRSVSDVQSMILRIDGKYDVVCKNGSNEVVTVEQIKADKVCGGPCPPPPANVVAVFSRPQGDFFVLCKNSSWKISTAALIQQGNVCNENNIIGKWLIGARWSGNAKLYKYEFQFKNDDTVAYEGNIYPDSSWTLTGTKISFKLYSNAVIWDGIFSNGSMSGTMKSGPSSGKWNASPTTRD